MKQKIKLLSWISATILCSSACIDTSINAIDDTPMINLEIITPAVGYNDIFTARIFSNATALKIIDYNCKYPFLVEGSEISKLATYQCYEDGINLSTNPITPEADEIVEFTITVQIPEYPEKYVLTGSFQTTSKKVLIPSTISLSESAIQLCPGELDEAGSTATIALSFSPANSVKDYVISFDRDDWKEVLNISEDSESITLHAPKTSIGGDLKVTVTSAYNTFISTEFTVQVRKDVALVITGKSCGDKARVTWNQYESYLFTDLYCYIAEYKGDLESIMRSSSKDASSISFITSQSSFNYDIEFSVKKLTGSQIKTTKFPYRCLSNAKMDLSVIRGHINSETDRKTRDHDTGYQYYTLVVSGLSYSSKLYNIKYIVHLYKAQINGQWVACNDFSSGYNKEKNKYWYAAADTDEWIVERK